MASAPQTLMLYDVYAIQQMYGSNTTTRSGVTTYDFNSNAGDVYNFTINTKPFVCIWDGGGNDTLDVSGYALSQFIDLREGAFSDIGGLKGNVSIAYGTVVENAAGGSLNDTVTGNAADNMLLGNGGSDSLAGGDGNDLLRGGAGNDRIDGGAGIDTVDFSDKVSGVQLTLNGTNRASAVVLRRIEDTVVNVENILGGSANDTLTGDFNVNCISGGRGR